MKNYKDYDDTELLYLIQENNEQASDILLDKYQPIINLIYNKYIQLGKLSGLESTDLKQEALLGYMDAIKNYNQDKNVKLSTFVTLCVERKVKLALIKSNRQKHKVLNDSLSLEYNYGDESTTLQDVIGDNKEHEPLYNIVQNEDVVELENIIKENLSENEEQVYNLMTAGFNYVEIAKLLDKEPKSIDNSMQRIKNKIKKILHNRTKEE